MSKPTAHDHHLDAVRAYEAANPDGDKLLYVSRPGDWTVHYVWTSGVQLGLAASAAHLNNLLTSNRLESMADAADPAAHPVTPRTP